MAAWATKTMPLKHAVPDEPRSKYPAGCFPAFTGGLIGTQKQWLYEIIPIQLCSKIPYMP